MAEMITPRDLDKVLSLLRRVYGSIVIDMSSHLNDINLAFLDASDAIIEIARRSQDLGQPAHLLLQRVYPLRNEHGLGGVQDGLQLSRCDAHLVQAFRFSSEPRAGVVRHQPPDMARESPFHMLDDWHIRSEWGIGVRSGKGKRAKQLGARHHLGGSGVHGRGEHIV